MFIKVTWFILPTAITNSRVETPRRIYMPDCLESNYLIRTTTCTCRSTVLTSSTNFAWELGCKYVRTYAAATWSILNHSVRLWIMIHIDLNHWICMWICDVLALASIYRMSPITERRLMLDTWCMPAPCTCSTAHYVANVNMSHDFSSPFHIYSATVTIPYISWQQLRTWIPYSSIYLAHMIDACVR